MSESHGTGKMNEADLLENIEVVMGHITAVVVLVSIVVASLAILQESFRQIRFVPQH